MHPPSSSTAADASTPDPETFLPFMRDVSRCEQSLQELNLMWRIIESSARMNCPAEAATILPTMAATRSGFARLEEELVQSLVQEKVRNVMDGIGTKAQYVIDIVVRNLFERTADVGFLATDRLLCEFVVRSAAARGYEDTERDRDAVRLRLREYRSKYTVYDEIILLDTDGNVLVQIDPATPLEHSRDPLVRQTLASDGYVETFRRTDLRPHKDRALVYSRRMHHPDTGAVVGVLCLCFHFEEEMRGIFGSHRDGDERSNLLLLDGDDRVISAADEVWIPPGTVVPVNRDAQPRTCVFGGREYLIRTFASAGYQGYPGPPGWQGQVMIPVDVAFRGQAGDTLAGLAPDVAEGLLSHAESFCPPLHGIMTAARTIQRIVWNGQVMTAGQPGDMQKLKTVLEQISETGNRSNALFARSIRDLYQTVLASSLRDAEFTSHLLVDLLDRNLYERADDCRWWALAPALRTGLGCTATGDASTGDQSIADVLAYINRLYTVYTRLFVYDRDGQVVASTGSAAVQSRPVVGSRIDARTLEAVRGLRGPQDYHVTAFEPTALYDGRPTYVYHAAVRDLHDGAQIVGGIGIVFDAAPEFGAMLRAGLSGKEDMSAYYVDRDGRILASTDDGRSPGSVLELDADLRALPNGRSASRITVHDGQYAVVACTASAGYREFKTTDGYREDVIAVVYRRFGEVRASAPPASRTSLQIEHEPALQDGLEFATFYCRDGLYAVPAQHVLEAVPYASVRPTPLGGSTGRIGILGLQRADLHQRFMWVYDLARLLGAEATAVTAHSQVMVVRHGAHTLGLLVDDLHAVPQFDARQIIGTPVAALGQSMLTTQMIKANRGALLIQALDIARLFDWLIDGLEPVAGEGDLTVEMVEKAAA